MPASSAIALDAYNNAEHAEVTKKTKRGQENAGTEELLRPHCLHGGGGYGALYGNAALRQRRGTEPEPLAADRISCAHQGAAQVWQCRVLRTHLYNKAGKDFE